MDEEEISDWTDGAFIGCMAIALQLKALIAALIIQMKGPRGINSLFEVVTCSLENVEFILKIEFSIFPKGCSFNFVFFDVFGDSLFTIDGKLSKL